METRVVTHCDCGDCRALAARVTLLEAASKLNDLRRQCAVELFDRGFIDDAHEDGCPEDDTCECALMPLMHAVLNDDEMVDVPAAETALAWCAKHSDACTPGDCVCEPAKEDD